MQRVGSEEARGRRIVDTKRIGGEGGGTGRTGTQESQGEKTVTAQVKGAGTGCEDAEGLLTVLTTRTVLFLRGPRGADVEVEGTWVEMKH